MQTNKRADAGWRWIARDCLFHPPKDIIVVLVRAYPDPVKIVPKASGNGSIGAAYGNRPDLSLGPELK